MPNAKHSGIAGRIVGELFIYLKKNKIGRVYPEAHFQIGIDKRIPDVALTCSHKIIPREWRESTKIKRGDSGYEKDIYGRTDCWNSARI